MTTQQPRIEPLPPKRASLTARLMYRYAKRRFGEVPVPFAVGAHHLPLLVANAVHETLLERGSKKLPAAVRDLAERHAEPVVQYECHPLVGVEAFQYHHRGKSGVLVRYDFVERVRPTQRGHHRFR